MAQAKIFPTECLGRTLIVTPQGDSHEFRYQDLHLEYNRLHEVIAINSIVNIILDLSCMRSLSSIMIATLARLAVIAEHNDGKCVICAVSDELRQVIDTHKLLRFGEFVATRENAIVVLNG